MESVNWEGSLTASPSPADSSITRILQIATDIPNLGINQPLALKVLPVQMLRSPETARGHGAALRILRDGDAARIRRDGHFRGLRKEAG